MEPPPFQPGKIISGGQTGVDRAALDVAIELGIPHGGYVPLGRPAEDGTIPDRYLLRELPQPQYAVRTEANVRAADATLIVSRGPLTGGSALTERLVRKHGRPGLHVDLARSAGPAAVAEVAGWLSRHQPGVLNVAGPRASEAPGIERHVRELLLAVFRRDADA